MNTKKHLCETEHYTPEDLFALIELLRGEEGCPWDREQTHKSLRKNLIEEAYEVAEGIDRDDPRILSEELGDLLFECAFHTVLAEEAGRFTRADVLRGILRKMISRHPHVFGDEALPERAAFADVWDAIKQKEKGESTLAKSLAAIPVALPALTRAEKLIGRAVRRGGVKYHHTDALSAALAAFCKTEDLAEREGAIGELLFAAVGMAQESGISAEESLIRAIERHQRAILRSK